MISVIITTYNRKSHIVRRALDSVKDQTYYDLEIIVVDDNPFENGEHSVLSIEIEKEVSRDAVYIKNPEGNSGANKARNIGIEYSKGDYIAFLDDDDYWLPEKLLKQITVFDSANDSELGLVFCSGLVLDENNKTSSDYYTFEIFKEKPTFLDLLRYDYIGSTSQPLIKRDVFDVCGKFDEKLPSRQDYEMWIRISNQFHIVGIKEKLFVYVRHNYSQITKSNDKAYKGYSAIYEKYKDDYKKDFLAYINIHYCINLYSKSRNEFLFFLIKMIMNVTGMMSKIKKFIKGRQ